MQVYINTDVIARQPPGGVAHTLMDVLCQSRLPLVGAYEVVAGADGLGHIFVVTNIRRRNTPDGRDNVQLMAGCAALGDDLRALETFVLVPRITCLACLRW